MGFLGDAFRVATAPFTMGASLVLPEQKMHGLPLVGGLFDDPAAKAKLENLHKMAVAYQAQRPELAQSQTNALNQTLGAYAPANNMLGQMYGQGAMVDLNALGQNPMTPGMMDAGVGTPHEAQAEINQGRGLASNTAPNTRTSLDDVQPGQSLVWNEKLGKNVVPGGY